MITAPLFWIALLSAAAAYRDAGRHKIPHPLAWAAAILLFWIAALPLYLWHRRKHLHHPPESRHSH